MKIHSILDEVIRISMEPGLIEAERERISADEAVSGLAELRAARADLDRHNREFAVALRDELAGKHGVEIPRPPVIGHREVEALTKQFPVADACLRIETWTRSNHVVKKLLGQEAIRRIVAGKDYKKAISEMEDKWIEYFRNLVR